MSGVSSWLLALALGLAHMGVGAEAASGRQECCRLAAKVYSGDEPMPYPRIMLLGGTGVGKSTLGNQLLGASPFASETPDLLSWTSSGCEVESSGPFGVGHTIKSKTKDVNFVVGAYLGSGQCVTLIDTPGFSDSDGSDGTHMRNIARFVMEEMDGQVSAFLLLFKNANRISLNIQTQLKIYQSIFGRDFWRNAANEITFWGHSRRESWFREKNCKRNDDCDHSMPAEERLHLSWNEAYHNNLSIPSDLTVPTLFIDPVLPIFSLDEDDRAVIEEREVEAFERYTETLLRLANNRPRYNCTGRCSAPDGVYFGAPWLPGTEEVLRIPEGEPFQLVCQVVTQFNRDASNNVGWRFGGGAVDSVDPRFSLTESQLEFGFGFNYALSSSAMRRSLHEGTYECENEVGKATVQVLSVSDCQWSGWGGWGRCGTNCGTSVQHRYRSSTPPRNGGRACNAADGTGTQACSVRCPKKKKWYKKVFG